VPLLQTSERRWWVLSAKMIPIGRSLVSVRPPPGPTSIAVDVGFVKVTTASTWPPIRVTLSTFTSAPLAARSLANALASSSAGAVAVMSPVRISTRRFCARPSGLSLPSGLLFGATGRDSRTQRR